MGEKYIPVVIIITLQRVITLQRKTCVNSYTPPIRGIRSLKPGFHIIAPVATIAAVVEKRVSATVAIYGNTLFSDSSDKYDSGDERR